MARSPPLFRRSVFTRSQASTPARTIRSRSSGTRGFSRRPRKSSRLSPRRTSWAAMRAARTWANTVSVGVAGNERRIVNLAPGTLSSTSTDAVNGNQLFAANQRTAAAFGTTLDASGQLVAPSYTVQGATFNNVAGAIGALDTTVTAINTNGTRYFQANSTESAGSATGANSIAVGSNATATASGAIAIGLNSSSTGTNAIAIGTGAVATGSVAVGAGAFASNGSAAFGDGAVATGTNATAIGPGASATFANSSAFGAGASATAVNQMAFGTASNTYRLPGITSAASLAAQSGPTSFVTSDAGGNLATTNFGPQNIAGLRANVAALQQGFAALQQGFNVLQENLQHGLNQSFAGSAVALALSG